MMNGTVEKGCSCVDGPNHPHFKELLEFVLFLFDWKEKSCDDLSRFVPISTYEDLCRTALHTVGIAATVLIENNDAIMVQKRLGLDCNEHLFYETRSENPNPDPLTGARRK
jgi:hypothetical protein